MRVSVRLIVSLIAGVTLVTFLFARSEMQAERRGLRSDLEKQAEVQAESLADAIGPLETNGRRERLQERRLQEMIERYSNRERLAGVAVYDAWGNRLALSSKLAQQLAQNTRVDNFITHEHQEGGVFLSVGQTTIHVFVMPLSGGLAPTGKLAIFNDASYIQAQGLAIWRKAVWHVLLQVLIITTITLLIVRWSIAGPIARTAQWLREIRAGRKSQPPDIATSDLMGPLSHEVINMARSLAVPRGGQGVCRLARR